MKAYTLEIKLISKVLLVFNVTSLMIVSSPSHKERRRKRKYSFCIHQIGGNVISGLLLSLLASFQITTDTAVKQIKQDRVKMHTEYVRS